MAEIEHDVNTTARMVVAIFEKRCGCYSHPCQVENKIRPKWIIYNKNEGENPKGAKHSPII